MNDGDNKWVDKIFALMDAVDSYIPTPERDTEKTFLMALKMYSQLLVVVL